MSTAILGQLRVFIFEDDVELCVLLVDALKLLGRDVAGFARDSRSAADMVGGGPSVALVDYNLLDGPCDDLLDTLRLAGVPTAIATAYRPDELPAKYQGFLILAKPFGIDALNAMVDRLASLLGGAAAA